MRRSMFLSLTSPSSVLTSAGTAKSRVRTSTPMASGAFIACGPTRLGSSDSGKLSTAS